MKIYFDSTLIDANNYVELTKYSNIYVSNNFKLGATICETYTLVVTKTAVSNIPQTVQLKDDNNNPLKTLYVTDYDDEDDFTIKLELEDAMTKFNFKYDASSIMIHTKVVDEETIHFAYLSEILDDICTQAGINTDISSFYGDDKEISWYNNTYMARDYLGYIAELNGKNFRISSDNKLEFVEVNTTPTSSITFDDISKYKLGVEHKITRVVYDNGVNPSPWIYGDTTGETLYLDTNNVYITEQADVEHIYNIIKDFTFYNFRTENCPLDGVTTGDLIEISDGTNDYLTFVQFNGATFSGNSWFGGLEVALDGEARQETKLVGEQERYRMILQTVDRMNNTITTVVADVNDLGTLVRQIQTDTYTKTEVQRIVDGTGVDGVKVTVVETASGTFDIDGMHYAKTGAETESTINEAGLEVIRTDKNEELLFSGYDTDLRKSVVRSENLITRKFLVIGENSRIQDYGNGGGLFIL